MRPGMALAWGEPGCRAVIRAQPEDFIVCEQLGFDPSGEGEHVFLHVEKRLLNTHELLDRVSQHSEVALRDIGFCGMKDRNAVTRQWISVGMAGKPEPDWSLLEKTAEIKILEIGRHARKLKRGVHRGNRFSLRLTKLDGARDDLEIRLHKVASQGVPNYFGEQRFGRSGQTLVQARQWMRSPGRKLTRTKRGFFLSALRSHVFNELLAARVREGNWNRISGGEMCMLQGSRSQFVCEESDPSILERCKQGDLHPGLPLWGKGQAAVSGNILRKQTAQHSAWLADVREICEFLESQGLELAYRSARLMADDFCWQFCDDGSLQLEFTLGPGGYATSVLAELVNYKKGEAGSGNGSEQH